MPQDKFTQVLPTDWNGKFPFTNDSDEDFVFTWAKKAYMFPARTTVDMMRMNFNATPLEVQQIRKFAAKKWAEREFFKSSKYEAMRKVEGGKDENGVITPRLQSFLAAGSYSEQDLKAGIQQCLTPLPEGNALVSEAETRDTEAEIHKDIDTGEPVSAPVKNATQSVNTKAGYVLVN